MRALIFLAAMVVLGVGVSETAEAESWKRCKTMTRQVEHFYGIVDLAKARENVLWEQATRQHIAKLEDKRLRQCPRYIERSQQIARDHSSSEKRRRDEEVDEDCGRPCDQVLHRRFLLETTVGDVQVSFSTSLRKSSKA